uniref:Uncharacterized protein n=1 Tax=Acrobeloides nanus TaxID=290746 RepID=A0A914DX04_9BILA
MALDNLYVAIRASRSDLVYHILKANSNLNLNSNLLRNSALSLAIRQQDINIVSILLERGCDVNKLSMHESDRLESPLITATRLGNLAIVRLLLAYNANPNIADIDNRTPLLFATREKHTKICAALIESGANLNIADKTGMTPLHFCCKYPGGRLEIAHMLVEHGANVNLPDFKGRLCLDYAEHSGSQFLIYLLLEAGSSISRDMRNRIRLYERARRRQSQANVTNDSATTSGVSSASDYSSETDNNDDINSLETGGNQASKLGFLITVRRTVPTLKSIMKRNIRRQLQLRGNIEIRKLHTSIWPKIDELESLPEMARDLLKRMP